jgi:hypothetical protein
MTADSPKLPPAPGPEPISGRVVEPVSPFTHSGSTFAILEQPPLW